MKDKSKGFLSEFEGTAPVFKFTLVQFFKNKANIVSMLIIFIMCFLSVPLSLLTTGGEVTEGNIYDDLGTIPEKVYVCNTTGVPLQTDCPVIKNSPFRGCNFYVTISPNADFNITSRDIIIKISLDEKAASFKLEGFYSEDTEIDENTAYAALYTVQNAFEFSKFHLLGMDDKTVSSILYSGYLGSVDNLDSFSGETDGGFEGKFVIQLLFSIVVLMLCTLSASYIIRTVVEEKSSKLVEFLLVNVKPLSLLAGKILAVMVSVFAMFGIMVAGMLASDYFSSKVLKLGSVTNSLEAMGFSLDSLNIGWELIVIVVISIVISYVTFSIISGISGACCNSMDEMSTASLIAILPAMIGYIATPIISALESPVWDMIASLFPIIGSFYAPAAYLLGDIPLWVMLISLVIQAIIALLLALFCRRVYSYIIMYKGNKLNLRALFSIPGKEEGK